MNALIFREWMTRYSDGWIGPFWAQVTPIIWIAFLTLLFDFLDRKPPINVPTTIFIAAGVLPYLTFRQTITSMSRTLIANRYLRYIRPTNSNEILMATSLVETLNLVVTAVLIFASLAYLENGFLPANLTEVMIGFALVLSLAVAVGRLTAIFGLYSDSFARFVPIALRPFFWISAIFYTATELPQSYQNTLWYNPLFHITEIVREGFFLGYHSPVATIWYPIFFTCCLLLFEAPANLIVQKIGKKRFGL